MPPKSLPSARREERVLLPSRRVAGFRIPNAGECVEINEEAAVHAEIVAKKHGGEFGNASAGIAARKIVLHRLLVGITSEPVRPIYKHGFDEAAAREMIEKSSAKAVAEGKEPLDVEGGLEQACFAAEDVDAMTASARLMPVSDLDWDEDDGYIGEMKGAELGTLPAEDWRMLNRAAAELGARFSLGLVNIDPKAVLRAQRPLRRSGAS